MRYVTDYMSPLGKIILVSSDGGLCCLWFEEGIAPRQTTSLSPRCVLPPESKYQSSKTPVLVDVARWLDVYFSGREPDFSVPLDIAGTSFQMQVWEILSSIPYGQTTTYGEIARSLAKKQGMSYMSAQAVGGAVARNPVSIIIPCHRVIGVNGCLTGYAGGLERKAKLLELEGINTISNSSFLHDH